MGFEKFGFVSYLTQSRVAGFVDFLEKGGIYGTKCKKCGCIQFPPRAHCARCLSTEFEWKEFSGDCKLITYTHVDAAPSTFKEQAPYVLGLAEFAEGPKVFAWLDKSIPIDQVKSGMKLNLRASKLVNGNICYTLTQRKEKPVGA